METRKFIYYFFLFILTGSVNILAYLNAVRDGGFWNWTIWVVLLIFVISDMNKIEETFKK